LPRRFHRLIRTDVREADLVIVIGTSLQVNPVAAIPGMVRDNIPRLLINREHVGDFDMSEGNYRDVFMAGNCDDTVENLCKEIADGWEGELRDIWESKRQVNVVRAGLDVESESSSSSEVEDFEEETYDTYTKIDARKEFENAVQIKCTQRQEENTKLGRVETEEEVFDAVVDSFRNIVGDLVSEGYSLDEEKEELKEGVCEKVEAPVVSSEEVD